MFNTMHVSPTSACLPLCFPPSLSPCNRSSVRPSYACVQLHACPQSVSLCIICSVRLSMSVFMHVSLYLSVPSFCLSVHLSIFNAGAKETSNNNNNKKHHHQQQEKPELHQHCLMLHKYGFNHVWENQVLEMRKLLNHRNTNQSGPTPGLLMENIHVQHRLDQACSCHQSFIPMHVKAKHFTSKFVHPASNTRLRRKQIVLVGICPYTHVIF